MSIRSLAWLLPLFFCCCNKQSSSNVPVPGTFTYSVYYDSVYTCYPNNNVTLSFSIVVHSGSILSNPVTVAVTGVPSNILVTPPIQTVTGIMGGAFTIALGSVAPGYDTLNLVISSVAGGTETHKIILNVLKPIDYALKLKGSYPGSYDFCQPDSFFNYTSVVTNVTDTPYLMKISNIKNLGSGFIVRAWVSNIMGSNIVTIPAQTVGAYTISGSGTFTHDAPPNDTLYRMVIHDTVVHGSITDYCTIHIQH